MCLRITAGMEKKKPKQSILGFCFECYLTQFLLYSLTVFKYIP